MIAKKMEGTKYMREETCGKKLQAKVDATIEMYSFPENR